MEEQLFKILKSDGYVCHGVGRWHLPQSDTPGRWMPPIVGDLIPCQNGYHLCRAENILTWLGPAIFEAEYWAWFREAIIFSDNKIVVRRARLLRQLVTWNDCNARLFACDCAEHTLHLFEESYPNDDRPRRAIEVARQYALDKATKEQLIAAKDAAASTAASATPVTDWSHTQAGQAAGAAARATARTASRATTWAWAAAKGASESAALARGWTASWGKGQLAGPTAAKIAQRAERQWQMKRLLEYLYPEDPD